VRDDPMPKPRKVKTDLGVTLVGGGAFGARDLGRALDLAPVLVAADGGANRLLRLGAAPRAVIGDMDSISPAARAAFASALHPVPAQDNTDFDKALAEIDAPFVLALGFVGARMDHGLAALAGLLRRREMPVILLGARDVIVLAPAKFCLDLPRGARVSLFPMGPVQGRSTGLEWPIEGLGFAPDGAIGTSNRATGGAVTLEFDAAKMLLILPRAHLGRLMAGFGLLPTPPSRAK